MELERLRRNDVGTLRSLDLEHRAGRIGHDTSRDDTPGRHAGARTATARHLGRHRRLPEPKGDRTLRLADKFCRITGGGSGIGCASALLFAGTSRRPGRSPARAGARPFPRGTLLVQVPRGPAHKRSWTAVWGSVHEAFIANPFQGGTAALGVELGRGPKGGARHRPGSGSTGSTWVRELGHRPGFGSPGRVPRTAQPSTTYSSRDAWLSWIGPSGPHTTMSSIRAPYSPTR